MAFISSARKQFEYYRSLGDKTFQQTPDDALFWQFNPECNSMATIVKHLWGNMLSRWTNFLDSDGEKDWRDREAEFENDIQTRAAMLEKWAEGWQCLFAALDSLNESDLERIVYIRNMGQSVQEAILRQLAHYSYHVGQIVQLGKMAQAENWQSLSIPRGGSLAYNADKFAQPRREQHFAEEWMKKQ